MYSMGNEIKKKTRKGGGKKRRDALKRKTTIGTREKQKRSGSTTQEIGAC